MLGVYSTGQGPYHRAWGADASGDPERAAIVSDLVPPDAAAMAVIIHRDGR